jgi:hypothetical protein
MFNFAPGPKKSQDRPAYTHFYVPSPGCEMCGRCGDDKVRVDPASMSKLINL